MNAPDLTKAIAANTAVIRGRITEVKRTENACYTDIVLPSPDNYSQPQNVRVVSSRMLGKPGEDLTVRVAIKGYRRKYQDKQGNSAYAVDISLSALDD
jgi:hypothetical protein